MNAELVSWSIAAELSLPFIILSIVLIFSAISSGKKNKEAVRKLILKIKNNEERQKDNLKQYLANKLAFDEVHSKALTKKIINERKFLFRNLISAILDKNSEALTGLDDDLSRITDHYHDLDISLKPVEQAPLLEEDDTKNESIEELKQEVKTLKHEVHITLTTLNNIFAEFSSMFGEEVSNNTMSVDQIITAMEAFSTKSDHEEESPVAMPFEVDEVEELDAFAEPETEQSSPLDAFVNEVESGSSLGEDAADDDDGLDFSIDSELDDIDSALDDLELGATPEVDLPDDEPSWDDAFEESGDVKSDEI